MNGVLDVLSVGRGHLRLTITSRSPKDRENARRTIEDMLRRGYAIFVEVAPGKPLERVKRFDPKRLEYIIEEQVEPSKEEPVAAARTRQRRLPAARTRATVVGRTAGG